MENTNHKSENIERKYLNKMRKNSLLELEKDFIDLQNKELKDRKGKIKREIEELFF